MIFNHTKIGVTIGPSSEDGLVLEKMVRAGMDFARLNFAHGTYEAHATFIARIREVERRLNKPIAILQDLQGPRIRIGAMPEAGLAVAKGDAVVFDTSIDTYNGSVVPVDYNELHRFLKIGERILIEDGKIELRITVCANHQITAEVIEPGVIFSHKGINLPDSKLRIPALSEKDKRDVVFGLKHDIDIIGMSFVSSASDIKGLRQLIASTLKKENITRTRPVYIMAKIERKEAVKNSEAIIQEADAIMIARGDLGLEVPAEEVPIIQKDLVIRARESMKPVVVATQLLSSMQTSRRPTRAEVSDVANAVIDGADGLLLTNETAAGKHPVAVVETVSSVVRAIEGSRYVRYNLPLPSGLKGKMKVLAQAALKMAEKGARALVCRRGVHALVPLLSSLRLRLPIQYVVATLEDARFNTLRSGVVGFTEDQHTRTLQSAYKQNKNQKKSGTVLPVWTIEIGKGTSFTLKKVLSR